MVRYIYLFIILLTGNSVCGQSDPLLDGNKCFAIGDYKCAIENYKIAAASSEEKLKRIAGYNLALAKKCWDLLILADSSYKQNKYSEAKELYESVLKENSNDEYVKKRLRSIDTPNRLLSVSRQALVFPHTGGEEFVNVTTDAENFNVDSVPAWCDVKKHAKYFVITSKENKSLEERVVNIYVTAGDKFEKLIIRQDGIKAFTLTVSQDSIMVNYTGVDSVEIQVNTNAPTYTIDLLPQWCSVQLFQSKFILNCSSNFGSQPRRDWFYVNAGGKEVKIFVMQMGKEDAVSDKPILPATPQKLQKTNCFNCPKTNDTWGLTAGYSQLIYDRFNNYDGFMFGMRTEPLFKYGFGLNTGLYLYSYQKRDATEEGKMQFDYYGFNVPLHAEYRFNFSKWFNLFAYAGLGFNLIADTEYEIMDMPATFEYGGGFRTGHVQINIGQASYLGDYRYSDRIGKEIRPFKDVALAISYMF